MEFNKRVSFLNRISVTFALTMGVLILAVVLSIGSVLFVMTNRAIEENTSDATIKMINQVNYDIEYYLQSVESTLDSLRYSDIVNEYFQNPNVEEIPHVNAYLDSLLDNREDIINVFLLTPDGVMISNDKDAIIKDDVDFLKATYYSEAINHNQMIVSSSHVQNIILGQYSWVVTCSRAIFDLQTGEPLGVILVDLNFSLISDMMSRISLGNTGYIFIIDTEGKLVYHPKHELINSGLKSEDMNLLLATDEVSVDSIEEGNKFAYVITSLDEYNWKVIGKVYKKDINIYADATKNTFISITVLSLIISILLSSLLARAILSPVNKLLQGMYRFQHGNLDVVVEVEAHNELGILTQTFNQMTKRIKNLVETNKNTEKAKRKSELQVLQTQINPHFLYNTLDSIVWMGETGNNEAVVKMTASLAKLFRISLNKGSEFVTIKQEIEHVESYLIIQQMRYGEKLNYTIEVDERLLFLPIVKIILQPIIENAIYHGIKKLPGNGLIEIRIKQMKESNQMVEMGLSEGAILIEVEDNGMGMDEATIEQLLNGTIASDKKVRGVGVYNVDKRLKLYYGEHYGISIESELFEGTIIQIKLPIQSGDLNEAL